MRILPAPGDLTIVLTYDPARARQILRQNRSRFSKRFLVNIDAESVEVEDDEGRLERYKVAVKDVEEGKKVVPVPYRSFMERMVPQLENSLIVFVLFGSHAAAARAGPPPMLRRSAAVLLVETIEDVPAGWERDATEIVEAYFADEQEMMEVLGESPPELRGITLGELERLAELPRERWIAEADRMRNVRLTMLGLERMKPGTPFQELPLDTYLRRHLATHLGRPRCLVFTGAPGSGKTTIAKAMAQAYSNSYLLDAGRVLERSRSPFLAHILVTLQYMGNVALVINELDHLVLTERRYLPRFLSFLEENQTVWIAGTVIDISPLTREQAGTLHSELLRPGRVAEVIPVVPPFEKATREGIVRAVARQLGVALDERSVRAVASAAPLLYPSDYISLVRRFSVEGRRALSAFVDTYDLDARIASVEALVAKCERLGNTSTSLTEAIWSHLERIYA